MSSSISRERLAHVELFNRNVRLLARNLSSRFPTDHTINRAKQRIAAVVDTFPIFVIEHVGPFLYKYRNEIYHYDDDVEAFFINNDFEEEKARSKDPDKAEMVDYLMPRAKECLRSLPPEEKKEYIGLFVEMLDAYLEWLECDDE